MDHLRTSASLAAMALALAISLVPATALAAKGGNGGGPGGGKGGGNLTAVDDSGSTAYDGSLTLDVLDNDKGGAKTVIDVTQGTLGTVVISDARNVSYTPDTTQTVTYPYTDTFTYTMTNKRQTSQLIGTVTVMVSGPPDEPDVRLVPLSSWDETDVRHVLATFAYGGLATDAQIATWAGMVPASAINEILTFGVNNDQLSPIVDANATYCGSMLELQQFWSSNDPANIMRFAQGRDFGYQVDPTDAERVFTSLEITTSGPVKDVNDANAAAVMDFTTNGNTYVGRAINFITATPFAFARGGN